jgi:hypothetical protein
MGNCPTCSLEVANKSLDPLCQGKRMWKIFILLTLVVLIGGWIIIIIYESFKKFLSKCECIKICMRTKNVRHSLDYIFNRIRSFFI